MGRGDEAISVEVEMDAQVMTILGVAGSLRRGSFNRGLIRAAADLAPAGSRVVPYELDDLSMFNADVEALGDPEPVRRFKAAIAGADALLIATPEYNRCVPGVLKNAIDWASRPSRRSVLTNKPVAIMGATTGGSGTARAQAHLRDGLGYTNGLVLPQPEVLVPFAQERFDEAGNLHDEAISEAIVDLVTALVAWVRQLREGLDRAA